MIVICGPDMSAAMRTAYDTDPVIRSTGTTEPERGELRMRVMLATDPGTPGWPNEDFAAIAPGAAVLLDGATTRRGADTGCAHGVAWYARTLGVTLLAAITAEPYGPLSSALADSIGDVRARHEHTCDLASPATPAATVTAVRATQDGIDYLALSDSTIAADPGDGRPPIIITDAHPAAGATPDAALWARTGTFPRGGRGSIILLSDGATRIADRYGLLSWPAMLNVVRDHGPAELIRQVREAEDSDPDSLRWPRGKARDDATIVYWQHD
jgi:Protein phosphatase 2C